MTTESNRPVNHDADTVSPVKASDFFPPGTGWNQAPATEDKPIDGQLDAQQIRPEIGRH